MRKAKKLSFYSSFILLKIFDIIRWVKGDNMENFKIVAQIKMNTFKNFSLHIVPSKNGIKRDTNCHRGLLCLFV